MLPFVLAANEMRRLWARKLVRLALVAALLVPVLYGGFYLYANWDPFSRLDKLPAALVVTPEPAGGSDDGSGLAVASRLVSSGTFDWSAVDAAEAREGVTDGTYAFALTLPASFTADNGASQGGSDKGLLVLTTGDAGDYVDNVVANRVVEEVRTAVAAEAGQGTADALLLGYNTIAQQARQAAKTAGSIVTQATSASTASGALAQQASALGATQNDLATRAAAVGTTVASAQSNLDDISSRATNIANNADTLVDAAGPLAGQASDVSAGASSILLALTGATDGIPPAADSVLATFDTVQPQILALGLTGEQATAVQTIIASARGQIVPSLDDIKSRAASVSTARTTASTVASQASTLSSAVGALGDPASAVSSGANDLGAQTGALDTDLSNLAAAAATTVTEQQNAVTATADLATKSTALGTAASGVAKAVQALQTDLETDDDTGVTPGTSVDDVVNSPLAVQSATTAGGGAYGVGLTPFLLGIATWIGAFVLFLLIRPLSTRALAARMPAWRVALGGWLPAAVLGVVQVALMLGVVIFGLGVRPEQPVALAGFLVLVSLAFTAALHALNAAFGRIGTLIGLLLLVLQLATAGGAFPWQTLPDALIPLHVLLPMGYVVDGLQALMYGGSLGSAAFDFAVLGGYLLVGLLISTFAARTRQRWTPARLVPTLVV